MAEKKKVHCTAEEGVAIVKKYANRRLYNTASSSYVTLEDLSKMVRDGDDFVVFDAKTGEDLTRSILTQIILEEDGKGRNLLPTKFLRQLIRYYDDSLRAFLPSYLEMSMENFSSNQDQIRTYVEGTVGRFFPLNHFEDMTRQNIALFQQATTMFGAGGTGDTSEHPADTKGAAPPSKAGDPEQEIRALNQRIESLQAELSKLVETQKGKPKR